MTKHSKLVLESGIREYLLKSYIPDARTTSYRSLSRYVCS